VLGKTAPARSAGSPELVTEERDIYFCPNCQPLIGAGPA
jgi:hypothetical protein